MAFLWYYKVGDHCQCLVCDNSALYTFIRHEDRIQQRSRQTDRETDRQTLELIGLLQQNSNAHKIQKSHTCHSLYSFCSVVRCSRPRYDVFGGTLSLNQSINSAVRRFFYIFWAKESVCTMSFSVRGYRDPISHIQICQCTWQPWSAPCLIMYLCGRMLCSACI